VETTEQGGDKKSQEKNSLNHVNLFAIKAYRQQSPVLSQLSLLSTIISYFVEEIGQDFLRLCTVQYVHSWNIPGIRENRTDTQPPARGFF
jgi:hypothetical protein